MVKRSRSMIQRAQAIFGLIEQHSQLYLESQLTKSDFQKVGISPKDMDQWLELILLIQNMPRLFVTKQKRNTHVDAVDNKFMLHLRKRMYDPRLNYEEREAAAAMYIKILVNSEKSKGEEIDWKSLIDDPWMISRPKIIQLAKEGQNIQNNDN